MSTRRLKIESLFLRDTSATGQPTQRFVPLVRLKGRWLERAGFQHGAELRLTIVSPGVIELRVHQEPVPSPEFQNALAGFAQVGL
jgi:hypothetical protein